MHRKLLNSAVWDNESVLKIWIWCLLRANYKSRQITFGNQVVELEPGQFVTGRYSAGEELNMNPSTFWKRVKTLEKLEMIEIKSNNKYSVISVINWASYQLSTEKVTTKEQQSNNKVTSKEQQSNTDKKVNKVNKDNKVKNTFGEYANVKLSTDEYESLVLEYGEQKIKEYIDKVDLGVQSKGYKYKDFKATIKAWIKKDGDGPKATPAKKSEFNNYDQRTYDYGDLERKLLGGGE